MAGAIPAALIFAAHEAEADVLKLIDAALGKLEVGYGGAGE